MRRQIELSGESLEFDLRVSRRARRLRLSISPAGAEAVTLPHRMSEFWVERFMKQHAEWLKDQLNRLQRVPPRFTLKGTREEYVAYKEQARALAENRIAFFNQTYQQNVKRISIRNTGTRWGSCSRQGNLNFNYKVAMLRPELADYIFVHELCHLIELNHSARFWSQVARTVSSWRELRRELRKL